MPTVLVKNLNQEIKEISFEIENDEIIFEALEKQNFKLPHGCLAGSCGACKVEIIEGKDNLKDPSAVESDTINFLKKNLAQKTGDQSYLTKNIRLTCRARIKGNITISKI